MAAEKRIRVDSFSSKEPEPPPIGTKMWEPDPESIENSQMNQFMKKINEKYNLRLDDYDELWQWSVDNISDFWEEMWDFLDIRSSQPYSQVIDDVSKMPGAQFFVGARLNFAENILRYRDDHIAYLWTHDGSNQIKSMTYNELYDHVARVAHALRSMGVEVGDRVVGFVPNCPYAAIAMLATTSIGAIWSSCSPDFGLKGVTDRFGQILPKVLFTADGYYYKGKKFDCISRVKEVVEEISGIERIIVFPFTVDELERVDVSIISNAINYNDFVDFSGDVPDLVFEQLPFDHPVYIMYSSGTTGLPKCIVQGQGVLINHLKELVLHTDLRREDRIFYFTTCGWMMWNWLTSSLGVGATLVLFDGFPMHPDNGALFKLAQDLNVTVFGTSAKYLSSLKDSGCHPVNDFDLSHLRCVLSTGSPATVNTFNYVYTHVKEDVQFASISGGTDLNGCFALGCPVWPVHCGELQCRGLGLKVEVWNDDGKPVVDEKGELVCLSPFPSMPLFFWNDADNSKYKAAYFDTYLNVWHHGDFAELTSHKGMVIYGRSDATLNPGGVRIGTADIYRVVEESIVQIDDSVAIGQDWEDDVRVILFVKMAQGESLSDELIQHIKREIRTRVSPRHVPAKIIACPDIPYTLSGKKVELAVKKMVDGKPVTNRDALRNPYCLDFFSCVPDLL